jgi:hypothetical protein
MRSFIGLLCFACFFGGSLLLADSALAAQKKGKVVNQTDDAVVVKVVGVAPNNHIRLRVRANSSSHIFPLATGHRVLIAWDEFDEIIHLEQIEVTGNTRFRITGAGQERSFDVESMPLDESGGGHGGQDDDDFDNESEDDF